MTGRRTQGAADFREDLSSLILQFNSVQGLVNSIAQSQTIDSIFSAMVEGIGSELGYDRVGILTLEPARSCFRLDYVQGLDPLRAEKVRIPLTAGHGIALAALHQERINILRCLNERSFAPSLYAALGEDSASCVVLPLPSWHQKACWQMDYCMLGFSAYLEDPASWREVKAAPGDLDQVCSHCPFFPLRAILWADNRTSGRPVRESLFPLWVFTRQASLSIENLLLLERSRQESIRDALTGLYNRRHFLDILSYEIERGRRLKHPLGLTVFDIDGFRRLNRSRGYKAGDEMVRLLGELLRRSVRTIDVVARVGTDSFAVLFPDTEPGDVGKAAARLRLKIERSRFAVDGGEAPVTASGGTAIFPDDAGACRDLLYLAERALQSAREQGGNRIERTPERARRHSHGTDRP